MNFYIFAEICIQIKVGISRFKNQKLAVIKRKFMCALLICRDTKLLDSAGIADVVCDEIRIFRGRTGRRRRLRCRSRTKITCGKSKNEKKHGGEISSHCGFGGMRLRLYPYLYSRQREYCMKCFLCVHFSRVCARFINSRQVCRSSY